MHGMLSDLIMVTPAVVVMSCLQFILPVLQVTLWAIRLAAQLGWAIYANVYSVYFKALANRKIVAVLCFDDDLQRKSAFPGVHSCNSVENRRTSQAFGHFNGH